MPNDEKQRFDVTGLDLNRPVDSTKPGKLPYMKNARTYTGGTVGARLGITDLGMVVANQSPVHSIRRLNDPLNSTWMRTIGTGTYLAVGQSFPFTQLDSGYSGDPLALVPWSPQDAPYSFMYIGDRSRMRKTATTARLHTIGWAAPNAAPGVALSNSPAYKVVDSFQATTGWGQAGTAGAPTLLSGGSGRVNTTIAQVLYDSGSTGWACISPTSQANINQGVRLIVNAGAETVTVQQVYAGAPATTTIGSILYDSGTTGLASVVLAAAIDLSIADILIRNSTVGPENARVLSATKGPNGQTSIRISTTNAWAAGNTVQLLPTFRAYFTTTVAATNTIVESFVRTAVTVGTGTLSKTSALDLSILATGVPSSPEDYMHISMRVSDPTVITELKVLLDVDIATNDFTQNYYWRSFRASDLTPAASNLQSLLSTRAQILQRNTIDTVPVPPELQPFLDDPNFNYLLAIGAIPAEIVALYSSYQQSVIDAQANAQQNQSIQLNELDNAISQQMNAGANQWVELTFHLGDLIRVGSDFSRTLANVAAIRIVAIVTGSTNLDLDSWWVGGGYGPDSYDPSSSPYFYRYRAREILTNVPSNFSPASRYIADPLRQSVTITPTQYTPVTGTSLSTSDFTLDIERFGGLLPEWRYVGSTSNSATPTFTDFLPDDIVASNPKYGNVNFQPWPVIGIPVTGTTASSGVSGTSVTDTGTNFSTSWAPGNTILINGVPFTIYRVVSTSKLELVENAGTQSVVSWRINAPTILAQPLPCLWQWDNRFFACGDSVNAGRLYFSNPDSETTVEANYLDVTAPSEPLMNGVQYNVRSFLWSSENFMQILSTNNPSAPYQVQQIPGGKGLFSRWALTREPAPILCALGKDGIYATIGGSPTSMTDPDLYPLFPHEGNAGSTTNGVVAPYTGTPAQLRLHYYDDYLYFDYKIPGVLITSGCPTDDLEIGVPYTFTLTASGGLPPYTFQVASGSLPDGLTLDSSTGIISGTPTTAGTFSTTYTATDSSVPPQVSDPSVCELIVPEIPPVVTFLADIMYADSSPYQAGPIATPTFWILDGVSQIMYRSRIILPATTFAAWETMAIPSGQWLQLAGNANSSAGLTGCFGADAKIMTKNLPATSDTTDYPWVAYDISAPMHGGTPLMDDFESNMWSPTPSPRPPVAAINDQNIFCAGEYPAGTNRYYPTWGISTNTPPAGTWNKLFGQISNTIGNDRKCLAVGLGTTFLRWYNVGYGDMAWQELPCPNGDWRDVCTGPSDDYAFCVGVGADAACANTTFPFATLTTFVMPTGWTGINPRVVFDPNMYNVSIGGGNDGTYIIVGGEISGVSVVVCVPIRNSGATLLTPIVSTLPSVPADVKWRAIAANQAYTGVLIVGDSVTDGIIILSNPETTNAGTPATYDDWAVRTLAQTPFA